MRLFHRRDSLVRHTLVEQCQQRIVREVNGRFEQGNRRAPLVSIDSFKADPGSEPQWRSHSISDRYDFRVSEFEVSWVMASQRELTPQPMEVFFPRVRTPCGHGAQIIIEGREMQSDGGKGQRQPNNKPNKTNHSPQAETPPPSSISSVLG